MTGVKLFRQGRNSDRDRLNCLCPVVLDRRPSLLIGRFGGCADIWHWLAGCSHIGALLRLGAVFVCWIVAVYFVGC